MQKIFLNVIPDGIYSRVYVNQFDIGRQFQIAFKEDLIPYDFPNGVTFKINGRKADNHTFEYTESDKYDETHYVITKSGSGESLTITISTTEQMTAAAGDAEVQLTFKDSVNRVLGTLNFILAVQERPASVGDPSESDLPDIVRSVNGITPDADGDVQLGATGSAAIGAANISPVEQTRTMTSNHAAGTHVYVAADDQRYLVGSNPINAGATLTPGSNATSRSVDQDIEQLTSDITYQLGTIQLPRIPVVGRFNLAGTTATFPFHLSKEIPSSATLTLSNNTSASYPTKADGTALTGTFTYSVTKADDSKKDIIISMSGITNGDSRGMCSTMFLTGSIVIS